MVRDLIADSNIFPSTRLHEISELLSLSRTHARKHKKFTGDANKNHFKSQIPSHMYKHKLFKEKLNFSEVYPLNTHRSILFIASEKSIADPTSRKASCKGVHQIVTLLHNSSSEFYLLQPNEQNLGGPIP